MTIETKYKIGDKVWFLAANRVQNGEITSIEIEIYWNVYEQTVVTAIKYKIYYAYDIIESFCYDTKEELIKGL